MMPNNKKYYWIKLRPTFFQSKEIKKLRRIAGGDTFVIIYLKMQLLSLENNGKLYFDNLEEEFAEELALTLDEDSDNVRMTIGFLQRCGLIEQRSDDEYFLPEVSENTGKESPSAARMRKHRALQCDTKSSQCDTIVTKCDTEIDIDIEKDKDSDKEKDSETDKDKIPYAEIVDFFNETCKSFPKVKSLSKERKGLLNARFKEFGLDGIKEAFMKAEKSDFLKGKINGFKANFDWIIKPSNMCKVIEGNYDNRNVPEPESPKPKEYVDVLKSMGLV